MKKKIKLIQKKIDGEVVKIQARTASISFKALGEDGTFEAYASIFGNVDSYGEVVDQGAFKEWLADYFDNGKGRYPKCVWNHNWDEPIAKTLECREDERGLYVKGKFVMEVQRAKEIYALMKEGVITDFSFGFRVLDDEWDEQTNIRHLKKIAIYEYSPVLVGANREATILGVKADGEPIEGAEEVEEEIDIPAKEKEGDEEPKEEEEKDPKDPAEPKPAAEGEGEGEGAGNAGDGSGAGEGQPEQNDNAGSGGEDEEGKGLKQGRVLSAKNREAIKTAVDGMRSASDALEALLEATEDDDSGKSSDTSEVEGHEGKGSPEKKILKGILRDARKADKMVESIILRAKQV
ncbi:MAG TPA: HK97 family phage prohead protease [Candidatus Colwellbacteria bacterium]|nr:HK97 family phage prohead protease [Candidatus Colwellbacteria bacterium]